VIILKESEHSSRDSRVTRTPPRPNFGTTINNKNKLSRAKIS
jgi:hypothetical protein